MFAKNLFARKGDENCNHTQRVGGNFYGVPGSSSNGTVFPTLAADGPDDTDSGANARGRWIPTVAVDQYGATLTPWLGVNSVDLPAVFQTLDALANRI
jgi:hypothetical protein